MTSQLNYAEQLQKEVGNFGQLMAIFDGKTFGGKAIVIHRPNGEILLRSYETIVAEISKDNNGVKQARIFGTYSATTMRHIKEFLLQNGFTATSKGQIVKDYLQD